MSTYSLDKQFAQAVEYVRNTPSTTPISDDTKLLYYAHYKQATLGDVTTEAPSRIWFKERAKWNAWNNLKGMPQDKAKQTYIQLVFQK